MICPACDYDDIKGEPLFNKRFEHYSLTCKKLNEKLKFWEEGALILSVCPKCGNIKQMNDYTSNEVPK